MPHYIGWHWAWTNSSFFEPTCLSEIACHRPPNSSPHNCGLPSEWLSGISGPFSGNLVTSSAAILAKHSSHIFMSVTGGLPVGCMPHIRCGWFLHQDILFQLSAISTNSRSRIFLITFGASDAAGLYGPGVESVGKLMADG